jgi:hypothetical protein
MNKKDAKSLVIALNATGPSMFKYPIGNKELCERVKQAESMGLIKYNALTSLWASI